MTPTFSIIIPVYNVAPYLRECLDSVLAQTYTNWEAICVDDGSTDGSGAILDEYANKDNRFRVLHQANAGVSAARNAALDVASGVYVIFVDGDDAISPGMLTWYLNAFKKHPNADGLAFSGYIESEKCPSIWPALPKIESIKYKTVRDAESAGIVGITSTIWVYKFNLLGDLRFDTHLTLSEDSLFAQTYWWKITNWMIIRDATFYFYRQRKGSAVLSPMTLKKVSGSLEANIRMVQMYFDNADKWSYDELGSGFKSQMWSNWFTTRLMFFRLPTTDMTKCLDLWLKLQKLNIKLAREASWRHRLLLAAIDFFHSGWLCKKLVMLSARLSGNKLNS